MNNRLHLSEHMVCTHTRAANFACQAPQWSSLYLRARCSCTDVKRLADHDGSDYTDAGSSTNGSDCAGSVCEGCNTDSSDCAG